MPIPITTVIKIKPVASSEDKCLQWMQATATLVSQFDGFLSREIYKSVDQEGVLVTIFTFDSKEHLELWENSKQKREQVDLGKNYVGSLVEKKQFTGLEFWFESATTAAPIKWKMLIVTIAIIFILLNLLVPVIQQLLNLTSFPVLLKNLIGVSIMVGLMTYVIMPCVTKWLEDWLIKH
jgi:antibiotic biosynthesis monooxygenase (ABM) superfamily enzyme